MLPPAPGFLGLLGGRDGIAERMTMEEDADRPC